MHLYRSWRPVAVDVALWWGVVQAHLVVLHSRLVFLVRASGVNV
jgi:hypothetical protein